MILLCTPSILGLHSEAATNTPYETQAIGRKISACVDHDRAPSENWVRHGLPPVRSVLCGNLLTAPHGKPQPMGVLRRVKPLLLVPLELGLGGQMAALVTQGVQGRAARGGFCVRIEYTLCHEVKET